MAFIMNVINTVFGIPLGYVMYFCFQLVNSYGWAIILFTLISKIILIPISLLVQKNSIKMVEIQPLMDEIKQRYAGDKDKIAEEQIELYKREKYKPSLGCLPTLLQIPLILGLLDVIYNPLRHLLHLGQDTISAFTSVTTQLMGVTDLGYGPQLKIIDMVHSNPGAFDALRGSVADFDSVMESISALNMQLWGFDLSKVPGFAWPLILIPILSALSAFIMCIAQNHLNVLQREQGALSKWGMTIFLVVFSGYFAFLVPGGVGLYWIAGNLLAIPVMLLCNVIYNPRKLIDYANRAQKPVLSKAEKAAEKLLNKTNKARSKADEKRFYADEDTIKQLVFYSASNGFYKYFRRLINYILENSDLTIHYVTGDPKDEMFTRDIPRVVPYYIQDLQLIPFMMKMDSDMVVMTMPDLGTYHIKRSLVRKDIKYVYLDHSMTSLHMGYREGAFDHYDTMFCVNPQQIEEVRATEKLYELPKKRTIEYGYGLLDDLLDSYNEMERISQDKKLILIAPSWQVGNILENGIDDMLGSLMGKGYQIIVRPHPEFVKRFPDKMQRVLDKYKTADPDELTFETDFTSNTSTFTSDLLITDWSAIAFEFSYTTLKPSLFVNTPMKIMNPEYKRIQIQPLDITLRDKVGVSIEVNELARIHETVADMFDQADVYRQQILHTRSDNVFNIGCSEKAGGQYIIETLAKKKLERTLSEEG